MLARLHGGFGLPNSFVKAKTKSRDSEMPLCSLAMPCWKRMSTVQHRVGGCAIASRYTRMPMSLGNRSELIDFWFSNGLPGAIHEAMAIRFALLLRLCAQRTALHDAHPGQSVAEIEFPLCGARACSRSPGRSGPCRRGSALRKAHWQAPCRNNCPVGSTGASKHTANS